MTHPARILAIFALALGLSACDLAEQDRYALHITAPYDEATFVDREDTDPNADGMQIAVRVETSRDGTPIELLRLVGGAPDVVGRGTSTGGVVEFPGITLFPGANRLMARDANSGRTSARITVYFEDPCGAIRFISPEPPKSGEELLLGPQRGENACGESFSINLVAATGLPDQTRVMVLAEYGGPTTSRTITPVASGATLGGTLSIPNVPLEQHKESMRLALQVAGKACRPVYFPTPIRVDCEGPSCRIEGLEHDTLLTSRDDQDTKTLGLDLQVTVSSDASAVGQPVELVINGDQDNARVASVAPSLAGTRAVFSSVALPEGPVRLKATCRDAAGARTTSQRTLRVDTLGCAVSVNSPSAGSLFVAGPRETTRAIDVNASLGSDCAKVRFAALASADCAGLGQMPAETLSVGQTNVTRKVQLSAHGDQFLCVGTEDLRGNPNVAAVPIRFENEAPSLAFTAPQGEVAISRLGGEGRLADQNPGTRACETAVSVACKLPGKTVTLVRVPDEVQIAQATCLAEAASFPSVGFPSQNNGQPYSVVARMQGDNGLEGESAPLSVQADCDPPLLSFPAYLCGVTALSDADDEDPAPGLQHTVRVANGPNPKPPVTLSLNMGGALLGDPLTSSVHAGPETLFQHVTLPEGVTTLEACAVDASGNSACAPACDLLVGDVPAVSILAPAQNDTLYSLDLSAQGVQYRNGPPPDLDCDALRDGLQIAVTAVAPDVPTGRAARIKLVRPDRSIVDEVETSTASDGTFSACLDTEDGAGLWIRVEVDADNADLYGAAGRRIDVDTTPPSVAPTVSAERPVCRGPSLIRFEAGAASAASDELSFELRCAEAPIDSEAAWRAARVMGGEANPAGPSLGSGLLAWEVPDELPGHTRYCGVRGYDRAGAYTPLGDSVDLSALPLQQHSLPLPDALAPSASPGGNLQVTALGDVNGDGYDDVLIAGGDRRELGSAALFLGSANGLADTPALRFESDDSYELGFAAAALGNFDADPLGLMDFALAAPGSARLFVVLGRPDFPSGSVVLDAGGCGADLCVQGDAESLLGRALTSARMDLDDVPDLVAADQRGAVVLLGGSMDGPTKQLGASGGGRCLDARANPQADACGSGRSQPARGFRLEAPAPIDQVVSADRGLLFLAHGGSVQAPALWYARRRSYNRIDELVRVPASDLSLAHAPAAARVEGPLSALGDLNGDGLADLAWGHGGGSGFVYVYRGQGTGALTLASTVTNDTPDGTADAFGYALGQGAHPELGRLGDLQGDGFADLLIGSQASAEEAGRVDLFTGSAALPASLARSARALTLSDAMFPDADSNTALYPRAGQYLGDIDGDGNLELGVLEPAYNAHQGRLIVLGECPGP